MRGLLGLLLAMDIGNMVCRGQRFKLASLFHLFSTFPTTLCSFLSLFERERVFQTTL